MKDFYIRDAGQYDNKVITSSFVVASKQVKPKRTGELFLWLTLADRSGQIEAKMWDNVGEVMDKFDQDDYVKVKGLINRFNGRLQLTIHKLRRMEDSEIDPTDYLPRGPRDPEQLWKELGEFVATVKDMHLRALLEAFLGDPQIAAAYRLAPAAKTLHHAYIGGLLDHVVSLFRVCDLACRNYPHVNRDLLLAGAFLHDIGKIHELSYHRSFAYTTRGQLLGHMVIELEMLQQKVAQVPDFPAGMKTLLEHLIISHHGHYEFGSPKLPMFPEALMLHYLDDLDSKMESMRAQLEREAGNQEEWAGYNASLARPLLNSSRFLSQVTPAEQPARETEAAAAAAAAPAGELKSNP
jgi:3'-5' exoribonuclease